MSALLGGCAVSSDPAPRLASAIQSGVEPGLDFGVGCVYPVGTLLGYVDFQIYNCAA